MTDLIVNPTEARRDFFNLYKLAAAGKRKVIVEGRKSRIEFVVKPKRNKKVTWKDLAGGMSDKDYEIMVKTLKKLDRTPARGVK